MGGAAYGSYAIRSLAKNGFFTEYMTEDAGAAKGLGSMTHTKRTTRGCFSPNSNIASKAANEIVLIISVLSATGEPR